MQIYSNVELVLLVLGLPFFVILVIVYMQDVLFVYQQNLHAVIKYILQILLIRQNNTIESGHVLIGLQLLLAATVQHCM